MFKSPQPAKAKEEIDKMSPEFHSAPAEIVGLWGLLSFWVSLFWLFLTDDFFGQAYPSIKKGPAYGTDPPEQKWIYFCFRNHPYASDLRLLAWPRLADLPVTRPYPGPLGRCLAWFYGFQIAFKLILDMVDNIQELLSIQNYLNRDSMIWLS